MPYMMNEKENKNKKTTPRIIIKKFQITGNKEKIF